MKTPETRDQLTIDYMIHVLQGAKEGRLVVAHEWGYVNAPRIPHKVAAPNWDLYCYSLAPEPPKKRWRPWKLEEVPLRAEVRAENGLRRMYIVSACLDKDITWITPSFGPALAAQDAFRCWTMADGSPCGVEEEVRE